MKLKTFFIRNWPKQLRVGGRRRSICRGRKMKILSMVFWDFGKDMVGKRYFQHKTVPFITGTNNKKSGIEIIINDISIFGHLLKKNYFLLLTLFRFLEHLLEDFWNLKMLYCNMQISIYFYTSFILIMW